MKGTDKFLIAIVAGSVVLVAVVLALALLQPGNAPAFQPDDTPEGVAHNYLLALQLQEYGRAYGYLSSTVPGYPASLGEFTRNAGEFRWDLSEERDVSLAVESVEVEGDQARIVVRETMFSPIVWFDGGPSSTPFTMTLLREHGAWKISDSERYWAWCWREADGCP